MKPVKIVVLDGYALNPGDQDWEPLEKFGELVVYERTGYDAHESQALVVERAQGAQVLLTNKTPLTAQAMEQLPDLQYIGVLATGYNIVDVTAAEKQGVAVTNIPTYGTAAVAQMTIALLLEMCHHVGDHSQAVHAGEWSQNPDWSFWKFPLIELDGKILGLIGFGRIGQAVARIAQALGMKVLVHTPRPDKAKESESLTFSSLESLFQQSDFISLHCPLFPETRGIINQKNIELMKPSVRIVNTSRGPLIVEEDLAEALSKGRIAGAALDVVSAEPIGEDNPLLKAPNCLLTPHISWAPIEARRRLMALAAANLKHYLAGDPIHLVNHPVFRER
ncbi:D-2-hydroxyacid dehydrogenase [Anoxynatronum buryatiense]|uniref:Glycerate dehydrogenase n=1 Tax=Anoxynatronum buryatiense TaxID=489973 RepID=A0AA45WTW5_9CLOT|nr:D-2-hydroxyacid dehydrogenase [Anoxynatronum buryatiense]SMP44411.1 glycerate dehydrogenase [Anoxynatronum buryatiense]